MGAVSFRSGWCHLGAEPWSHARCLGGFDARPCVCDCHSQPLVELVDAVDQAALEQLVAALDGLLVLPGVWPPALRRLRDAAVELLAELAGPSGGAA